MMPAFLRRKIGPMPLTGGVLALTGIAFLIVVAFLTTYMLVSRIGTVPAQGDIVSCASRDEGCQPIVHFQTRAGQSITFREGWSSSTFEPEDAVPVRYHPDDPYNAHVDLWTVNRFLLPIFGAIGLLLFIVGALLFLFGKNHPAVTMLDRYYTALQHQDYAAAFSFLHPGIKNPQGKPATIDWFSQRAQAYDRESGTISRTALTHFSLNRGHADFTVKVVRGDKKPYQVKLNALALGDTWKINGFTIF